YLNIYWRDGRGFEWKPGASEGICYPCDETQMDNYLVFWINRGGLYNYPLKYFPASQPDGTYNLDLPDSDPLKEDYPNVKVTVVEGKVWVSEATLISRKNAKSTHCNYKSPARRNRQFLDSTPT